MNLKNIALSGLAALLIAGCSQPPSSDPGSTPASNPTSAAATPAADTVATAKSFEAKVSDTEDLSFDPKSAWVDVRPDLRGGQFAIGNSDFAMEYRQANRLEQVTGDGQVRVNFSVKAEKGGNATDPVQPGEYSGENLNSVIIFYGNNGGQSAVSLDSPQGAVVITSTTADEIVGTIDVTSDAGKSVKGSFTAKRTKE